MKIEYNDGNISIFVNNSYLDIDNWDDKTEISDSIRKLLVRLRRYYKLSLNGFYKVIIYVNEKYGVILDIEKLEDFDFRIDNIDLKIMVNLDSDFYIEMDNCLIINDLDKIYMLNDKFYINIDKLSDREILTYLEYGKIIYGKKLEKIVGANSCF